MAEKCPNCRMNGFLLFPSSTHNGYYSCIYCGYTIGRRDEALRVYVKKFKCIDNAETPLQLFEKRRKKRHEVKRG